MRISKDYLVDSYDYEFDESLIAKEPIRPKERAKLLVYSRKDKKIIHTNFGSLLEYIPKKTSIIFNNTKVIKARLFGKKLTGGKIEILINRPIDKNRISIFVKGKVKIGTVIEFSSSLNLELLEILSDGSRVGIFSRNGKYLDFSELIPIINSIGLIPLPPYISRNANADDEIDYQTVFAKEFGAVAAPTASLHFSDEMMKEIELKFKISYLTLHVGAGTFKPVDVSDIRKHSLHKEGFEISESAEKIITSDNNILAIGTTVTRTIEYFEKTKNCSGEADIFLHPNNPPKRVNHLLTNFHLPKSTLLMLIASFTGIDEMQKIYKEAIDNNYRFFSYGDAMLIL